MVNSIAEGEDYDSGPLIKVTNTGIRQIQAFRRGGRIRPEEANKEIAELLKNFVASEIAAGRIQNKTLLDRISDIFKGDTVTSIRVADGLRVRRNARGQAEEIVFVNPTNPDAETELSATARQVLNKLDRNYYNLLLNNLPTLGE
jgi:hypothetical protein